ncbi:MAG: fructosamine kinase family protein [Balneolaceae bacterium]
MLPDSILSHLTENYGLKIKSQQRVSGGSINRAFRLLAADGDFFLKYNASAPPQFFEKEARGLQLLKSAKSGVRIPEVEAFHNPDKASPGYLLMEWISEGSGTSENSFTFGRELASLHQARSETFGLDHDNFIGSLPQKNNSHAEWPSFFIEERINPQLKAAVNNGSIDKKYLAHWQRLANQLSDIFPYAKPSLLHGDLWSGNYLFDSSGKAVLIDPAVYYGHPEADLAFTKMFGGFSSEFYQGYESASPFEPGFSDRIQVYNLYPLLVHVNLFGGGYTRQAEQVLMGF